MPLERQARNQLVIDNLPLVGYLANDLCARATHLSREDLASVGTIALITAADSFDDSHGVPFGAYARRRILGAFADDMRSSDWATRGARKKITELRQLQETLTAALGRGPSDHELATAMGRTETEVRGILADASRTVVAMDETMDDYLVAGESTPEELLLQGEHEQMIRQAVEALPEKLRTIIQRIYFQSTTVKDLAAEMGVTHSAISQQRSAAMKLLYEALQRHFLTEQAPLETGRLTRAAAQRRAGYLADFDRRSLGGILSRQQPVAL